MTMTITTTENVKVWGVRGEMPEHNLAKFLDELGHVYHSIPFGNRPYAEIDFEPYYELGEHYAQVRVTYERPERPEETTKRLVDERVHWNAQLEEARRRVDYCAAQIDALPVERKV